MLMRTAMTTVTALKTSVMIVPRRLAHPPWARKAALTAMVTDGLTILMTARTKQVIQHWVARMHVPIKTETVGLTMMMHL